MIYLDNASTTKIHEEVFNAMIPFLKENFENPSSLYDNGIKNRKAINNSRNKIAKFLNCKGNEIYFTSSGSEANNWALKGILFSSNKREIITTRIEHHSTLSSCEFLEKMGYIVKYVNVDSFGFVDLDHLERLIGGDTALVSIMMANNEIGSIQDIKSIGEICRRKKVLFHTDAVQAVCHVTVDVKEMNIDLMSISAHKFNGPKGIGCLYINSGIAIESLIHGKQENCLRGGTENTPYIVGFAKAVELSMESRITDEERVRSLAQYLFNKLKEKVSEIRLNGPDIGNRRLPGNINVSFKDVDGSLMSYLLSKKGICVSTGSACNSNSIEPSHVLRAINVPLDYLNGTIRITLSSETKIEEINCIVDAIVDIINNKSA